MNVDIVRATEQNLAQLLSKPEAHLRRFFRQSPICWIGQVDGEGICVWGLIPPCLLSEKAYLWLWTSELAEQHTFLLVRYSQRMVEEMLKEFPIIVGHCEMKNHRAQRWLKWLGAEFDFPQGKLIPFIIRRK